MKSNSISESADPVLMPSEKDTTFSGSDGKISVKFFCTYLQFKFLLF